MRTVRVIGIGSPHGDDRIGWLAVRAVEERLVARPGARLETLALDRPGTDLVNHLAGADLVVLVDAVVGSEPAGTVVRLDLDDLDAGPPGLSTHGVGVGPALRLGAALGALPPELAILGVHVARPVPGAAVTPAVRAAAGEVARRVAALAATALARIC